MADNQEPAPEAEVSKKIVMDSAIATLTKTEGQPVRKPYIVKAKAGLFKNGVLFQVGDIVELDDQTANNFLALDEISEN